MHSTFLKVAAILGALAVALGAFGAHALKQRTTEAVISIFETGVRYQFYHVFALLLVGILYKDFTGKWMIYSGWLFIAGIIFFSGSLYLLTCLKMIARPDFNWVGAITPLGGIAFIAGWLCMFTGIIKTAQQ